MMDGTRVKRQAKEIKGRCFECLKDEKMLKMCPNCKNWICRECMVEGECVECYIDRKSRQEIDIYFKEKSQYAKAT